MSTLTALPREILKWLLSLDLSFTVRNVKRDFANGFLFAEILSRYFPMDVAMHSFENVTSSERKRANWALLERLIKRRDIPVEPALMEAVMTAEGDAASEMLQQIYAYINSDAFRHSLSGQEAQVGCSTGIPRNSDRDLHQYQQQQQRQRQQQQQSDGMGAAGHGASSRSSSPGRTAANGHRLNGTQAHLSGFGCGPSAHLHTAAGAVVPEAQQAMLWQAMLYQQQAALGDPAAAAAYAQIVNCLGIAASSSQSDGPAGVQGSPGVSDAGDELAYTKRPRPVDFAPYSWADYEARNYDARRADSYWELGRLGPDETAQVQAKREAAARLKELGRQITAANAERLAGAPRPRPKPQKLSARQRATDYAKQLPRVTCAGGGGGGRRAAGSAAAARGTSTASEDAGSGASDAPCTTNSVLHALELAHASYAAQVDRIRAEVGALSIGRRSLGDAVG